MSAIPILRGRSNAADGTIKWCGVDGKRLSTMLRHMKDQTDLEIVVRRPSKEGSDAQRKYYFGVIVKQIMESIGESGEDGKLRVHEGLKSLHARVDDDIFGPRPMRFSKMTTVQREEFFEKIRRWWAEFSKGEYIPLPNEVEGPWNE